MRRGWWAVVQGGGGVGLATEEEAALDVGRGRGAGAVGGSSWLGLGLELGADDYIINPFDPAEVVARVRARLRKPRAEAPALPQMARFEGWTAIFDRYILVAADGTEVPFSHAEGEVLRLFLDAPKRLISRAQMQQALGGAAGESFDRAMDVRISRLRTKLGEDPKNPRLIKTIYGAGYIFLGEVVWG